MVSNSRTKLRMKLLNVEKRDNIEFYLCCKFQCSPFSVHCKTDVTDGMTNELPYAVAPPLGIIILQAMTFLLCGKFGIKYEEGTIAFKKVNLFLDFELQKLFFFYFYHRFCQILVNSLGTALFCCKFNLVDTDQFSCEYLV